jgi:S1-C subfamily serine protease
MFRILILAALVLASARPLAGQATSTLRITAVLVDADQKPTPVPRHALLISDNPPSAAPRRVLTGADGSIEVAVPPGQYTVESDRPMAFGGKAYQWTVMIDVRAGGITPLALSQENAEILPLASAAAPSTPVAENDPAFLLSRWQDSVVSVWTATSRTSGFIVDTRGLVATSQRGIGDALSAEVQLTPTLKVAARVLAADVVRDVAVLQIHSSVAQSARPVTFDCTSATSAPSLADGQQLFAVGAPMRGPKNLFSGPVDRMPRRLVADLRIDSAATGGPVFTVDGAVAGITSSTDDPSDPVGDARVIPVADACEVLRSAEAEMGDAGVPSAALLPVEPQKVFADAALDDAAKRRVSDAIPYQMASSDFDISFITPVLVRAAERRWQQEAGRVRAGTARSPDPAQERVRLLTDFGHWSEYFEEFPPVLLVRVTPKLVEGFWTKVARGAASTQGVALPPMQRLTSGFSRLRVLCGTEEVTPIHPLELVHRIDERNTTQEGLYVFDPGALGPHCATVKLTVYSEKEPDKADTRVVDPKVVQQFWEDFASYRTRPALR